MARVWGKTNVGLLAALATTFAACLLLAQASQAAT
jgi:hypothetical protein